jgi:hypothetical protein
MHASYHRPSSVRSALRSSRAPRILTATFDLVSLLVANALFQATHLSIDQTPINASSSVMYVIATQYFVRILSYKQTCESKFTRSDLLARHKRSCGVP